jgi:hypothetical protein
LHTNKVILLHKNALLPFTFVHRNYVPQPIRIVLPLLQQLTNTHIHTHGLHTSLCSNTHTHTLIHTHTAAAAAGSSRQHMPRGWNKVG